MAKFAKTDYQYFETIAQNDGFGVDEMKEWAEAKMEILDARKEKDRERAKAKRIAGDELQDAVLNVLTEDPMTVDMIVEKVIAAGYDCTHNKVVSKLSNLVLGEKVLRQEGKVQITDEEGNVKNVRKKVFCLA